jgi:predicted S18 family serine protease
MIEESVAQFMTQGKPAEALALVASAIARGETAELWNDWGRD